MCTIEKYLVDQDYVPTSTVVKKSTCNGDAIDFEYWQRISKRTALGGGGGAGEECSGNLLAAYAKNL